MRDLSPATQTLLSDRRGVIARRLFWIMARNRATGATEAMGLWSGGQDAAFVIGGEARSYFGVGVALVFEPIVMKAGLLVQMQRVSFPPLTPALDLLIQGYDLRGAAVELHRALFTLDGHQPGDTPHRVFKGTVNTAPTTTPEIGGEARTDLTLAGPSRDLTRSLPIVKSDEFQQQRGGDRFLRYADVSGGVSVWWGETRG